VSFTVDAKRFFGIKTTGDSDERLCKVGVDAPVAHFVGIGQGAARNPTLDAHVVELIRLSTQTRLDIAQALAVGQLREGHAQILIDTGERLDLVFSAVARNATTKRGQRQMLRDLREHEFAQVH